MDETSQSETAPKKYRWLAVALSLVMPGFGHLYLGRYRRAAAWLSPVVLAVVGIAVALRSDRAAIVGAVLSPEVLWGLLAINVLAALWRVAASIDAYVIAGAGREHGKRGYLLAGVGWFVAALFVVTPHGAIARLTTDALVLIDTVFVLEGEDVPAEPIIPIGTDAYIVPDPAIADSIAPELYERERILYFELDPEDERSRRNLVFREGIGDPEAVTLWTKIIGERPNAGVRVPFLPFDQRVDSDRITILLAGGDGGPGRGGMRTDTMMVATLDLTTGKAAVFGFPRNLGHTPLPRRFQNAFIELQQRLAPPPPAPPPPPPPPEDLEEGEEPPPPPPPPPPPAVVNCKCFPEQLNALYPFTRAWTKTYPNEVDPGMAMLRDTLEYVMGIPIDYYALADMAAFVDLVDAIGGVDVYVQKPLQAEVSPPREGDPWAEVDVDVGWNHLNGPQALAYARARKGSSDYVRMQRQRCMVRAVAAKAEPITLLRSFSAIVNAVEDSVVTNFPLSLAPDLLTAAAKLDFDDIETVGFVYGYWEEQRDALGKPVLDLGRVRFKVKSVIEGQEAEVVDTPVESECDA